MPEAAAADKTSLLRAATRSAGPHIHSLARDISTQLTLITINVGEQLDEKIGTAAGNVDKGAFLPQPHAGGDSQALQSCQGTAKRETGEETPRGEGGWEGVCKWSTLPGPATL